MPELNKANRQVCDVDIRILKTKAPFLKFDTANTTTAGVTSDSVYAMAKGTRRIAFQNPMEGTMTIEAQVYPFKFFALLSDGTISSEAVYAEHRTIKCTAAGKLPLSLSDGAVESSGLFVYPAGKFGDDASAIKNPTYSNNEITATAGLVADSEY